MNLSDIFENIKFDTNIKDFNIDITNVVMDSRKVTKGSLFVAVKGIKVDGHDFIENVMEKGAVAVVVMKEQKIDVPFIKVVDTRKILGLIISNFYGNPSKNMSIIGITGTNGKTSTAYFIEEILKYNGIKTGVIGTLGVNINGVPIDLPFDTSTTPDAPDLQRILKYMADDKVETVVMEVTSQGLDQERVAGIDFNVGILTNITQDHLDYHGTIDNYVLAKTKLFHYSKLAVINSDSDYNKEFIKNSKKIITYSIENSSDIKAMDINYKKDSVEFTIFVDGIPKKIHVSIPGKFTVYNILSSISALFDFLSIDEIIDGIKNIKNVPGRIENVAVNSNFNVFVDYAHSPDGILNITKSVREFTLGRVITVFGCGGDRDRTKRPIMGRIAGENSNYCIITSDNPRSENPNDIVKDVEIGILETDCSYDIVVDRKEAIQKAINLAKDGDSIIIAGKGHENYQIFKDGTIHFDDREVALEFLEDLNGKN